MIDGRALVGAVAGAVALVVLVAGPLGDEQATRGGPGVTGSPGDERATREGSGTAGSRAGDGRGSPGVVVGDLVPGDCVSGPSAGTPFWEAPLERVPCGTAYGGEVVAVSDLPLGVTCDLRFEGRAVCVVF